MSYNTYAFGRAMSQLWRETFSRTVNPDLPSISETKMTSSDLQDQLNRAALRNRELCNTITTLERRLADALHLIETLKERTPPLPVKMHFEMKERTVTPVKNPDSAKAEMPKKTETRKRRNKSTTTTHKPLF